MVIRIDPRHSVDQLIDSMLIKIKKLKKSSGVFKSNMANLSFILGIAIRFLNSG